MCYLIAKNNQGGSSLAIQMMHGKELTKLKQKLLSDLPGEEIQLLTVSRPSAYTEYEPFCFMDTPDHFAQEVITGCRILSGSLRDVVLKYPVISVKNSFS